MRDFEKVSKYSISELIDYIIKEFHIPLINDLQKLGNYIIIAQNIPLLVDKMNLVKEIFKQFTIEFLEHIEKEENIFFPELLKLEKGDDTDKKLIKDYINRLNIEHNELKNYLIGGKAIIKNLTTNTQLEDYNELVDFNNLIEKLIKDAVDSIHIEDNFLYVKTNNLINK